MHMTVYKRAMINPQKLIYTKHKTYLEHIHHTNDMSSITAIGINHAKILTGLKDSRLHNKLAESKAKNGLICTGPTRCSRHGHGL